MELLITQPASVGHKCRHMTYQINQSCLPQGIATDPEAYVCSKQSQSESIFRFDIWIPVEEAVFSTVISNHDYVKLTHQVERVYRWNKDKQR